MIARVAAPLHRSSAFRMGAILAGLFFVANLVAFVAAYSLSLQDLRDRAKQEVLQEVANLMAVHQSGGLAAMATRIMASSRSATADGDLLYLSAGPNGMVVGNVSIKKTFQGWKVLATEDIKPFGDLALAHRYLAYAVKIDDRTLVVARNAEALDEVVEIFSRAILVGLLASTVLAGVGTLFFVRRTEARISAIASTLDAVASGSFERRAPAWTQKSDDLGRVAQSINGMLDRLSDNISGLRQVSADIAHDLKTPIQRLRTTLEKLRKNGGATDGESEVVEDAIEQADGIVRTFQALLRIAQIEGGSPRARFQRTDLVELCDSIAEVFQPAVEESGRRFTAETDPGVPVAVEGDRDLLGQMLSNLLENAIRHTPEGAEIGIGLAAEKDAAVITISDTGPGVPEAEREKVFRRLYRLERSRTSEGNGLGLSLVAAVVDLHDGEVTLEDNAPGLRVVVRLPLIRAA